MSDASNNSISITSPIDQSNLVSSSNGQNPDTSTVPEDITSSSIFNLTDRLQIFSYTMPERSQGAQRLGKYNQHL